MEPGNFMSSAFILTLGKTKRGGINVPIMFIHISTETSCPRSAESNPPTCRLPVLAKTFEGLPCTVIMPVSSQLKIRCGGNLYLSITASNRSKNLLTVWGLKDLALAEEREREICLFASNFFNKLPLKTQKNNDFTF